MYVIFSAIYFAAGGTNVRGRPYIYSVLDYGSDPGSSTGLVLGVVLAFLPVMHFLFYLIYVARYWILYLIYGKRWSSSPDHTKLEEGKESSSTEDTELKELSP